MALDINTQVASPIREKDPSQVRFLYFFFQEIKKERSLLPSLVTHPFDTQQVETSSFSWDEDHGALSFLFVKSGSDI